MPLKLIIQPFRGIFVSFLEGKIIETFSYFFRDDLNDLFINYFKKYIAIPCSSIPFARAMHSTWSQACPF